MASQQDSTGPRGYSRLRQQVPQDFQPGNLGNMDGAGEPVRFGTFEAARDWAGDTVHGFPAWRVTLDGGLAGEWIVELSPGGPWACYP